MDLDNSSFIHFFICFYLFWYNVLSSFSLSVIYPYNIINNLSILLLNNWLNNQPLFNDIIFDNYKKFFRDNPFILSDYTVNEISIYKFVHFYCIILTIIIIHRIFNDPFNGAISKLPINNFCICPNVLAIEFYFDSCLDFYWFNYLSLLNLFKS